jgi:biopolymer transport protein ExbD
MRRKFELVLYALMLPMSCLAEDSIPYLVQVNRDGECRLNGAIISCENIGSQLISSGVAMNSRVKFEATADTSFAALHKIMQSLQNAGMRIAFETTDPESSQ